MSLNTPSPSSMDFLKQCHTGVNLIPGCQSVQYWVFTLEKASNASAAAGAGTEIKSLEDALLEAEIEIRRKRHFLWVDAGKRAFWFFGDPAQASTGAFDGKPEKEVNVARWGWGWKQLFTGSFKASELSVFSSKSQANMGMPPGSAAHANASPANGQQAPRSQAGQVSKVWPGASVNEANDLRSIYGLFIKSVVASFAFTLAREHDVFQLDGRTFVCGRGKVDGEGEGGGIRSLMAFTLEPTLANGGGLLISTRAKQDLRLSALRPAGNPENICIAPGGLSAATVVDAPRDVSPDVDRWKTLVRNKLRCRGIELSNLDPDDRWILLKPSASASYSIVGPDDRMAFYWPQVLCFATGDSLASAMSAMRLNLAIANSNMDDLTTAESLFWFNSYEHNAYYEPIHFAEQWFKKKSDRDKTIEDRAKKKRNAEMAKKQAENATLAAPSPLYTREGLQSTAGVYPTPPDGLVTQTSNASNNETINAVSMPVNDPNAHRSSLDMQHSDMMDLDLGAFDQDQANRQRPSVVSRGSIDAAMKDGNDDLFDDFEDEDMKGQDITDADFSFFDEPEDGAPDTDMMDFAVGPEDAKPQDTTAPTEAAPVKIEPEAQVKQSPAAGAESMPPPELPVQSEPVKDAQPADKVEDTPLVADADDAEDVVVARDILSPTSIRKKLFDFVITDPKTGRRASQFDPVAFNTLLKQNDAKYSLNGAYAYQAPPANAPKRMASNGQLPTSPTMQKKLKVGSISSVRPPTRSQMLPMGEGDTSSDFSDSEDEDSAVGFDAVSQVTSPAKSSFPGLDGAADGVDEAGTRDRYRLPTTAEEQSQVLSSTLQVAMTPPKASSPSPAHSLGRNVTLDHLASYKLPLPPLLESEGTLNPHHKDFINVAQIVAEQLSLGFINTFSKPDTLDATATNLVTTGKAKGAAAVKSITDTMNACSAVSSRCDLLKWICVTEAVPDKQAQPKLPALPQKKTMIPGLQTSDGTPVPAIALAAIPPPHVRVRRNEGLWDVLPPALPFWEQLGLAPASGKKNVMAFCIYPGNDDLRFQAQTFLDYLGAIFESSRLGAHVRPEHISGITDGMVPVHLTGEQSIQSALNAMRQTCVELGKILAGVNWGERMEISPPMEEFNRIDSLVIYMINPFEADPRGLMELCAAFWALYETYRTTPIRSPRVKQPRPDVVLQVLPVKYIASPFAPVVMEPAFFQKLAREVYDRLPPSMADTSPSKLPLPSAPAILLETQLLRKIDFKLQPDPPSDLLHENSHLHLAYARKGDWMSVAWTDATGRYQATSSYCLSGGRSFLEVARVVWQSTVEIMRARRVGWRLCICRVGSLEGEEMDVWGMLATSAAAPGDKGPPVAVITVVTCVEPEPEVAVWYDVASSLPAAGAAATGAVGKSGVGQTATGTPVGTPQQGVSPDNVLTPAATPNNDAGLPDVSNDPDAHLVDVGDETWGIILGHRTNVASSIAQYRPSLSTGYLLKSNMTPATALDDPDEAMSKGVVMVGVKLVWIGSSPKPIPPQQTSNPQSNPHQAPQTHFASSPTEAAATTPAPTSTPGGGGAGAGQQQMGTSTTGSSIPKVTADSILKDYLGMYRHLGTLARARGLRGTRRGSLPWHVVVALRGVEGLDGGYGQG